MTLIATPSFAVIDTDSSGDQTIVAANAQAKIKVVGYTLISTSALSVRWKSGASTNLSGAMALSANGGISARGAVDGPLFQTAKGDALVLNLSAATQVSGHVTYYAE